MTSLVLAVIATYRPPSSVVQTVEQLLRSGVDVCVVDDASGHPGASGVLAACRDRGAQVIEKRSNSGIGNSLNEGLRVAERQGSSYLLTLDQDTRLPEEYADACVRALSEMRVAGFDVAAVTAARLNGAPRQPRYALQGSNFFEATDPMQSGTIFVVETLRRVGGFREEFIMDCVDTDICLRLRAAGKVIAWVDEVEIEHALGEMTVARFAGRPLRRRGREIRVSNHSDDRRYYMTRNRIILLREYGRLDRLWYRKAVRAYSRESLAALLFEPHRVRRAATMANAMFDAMARRVGRRR